MQLTAQQYDDLNQQLAEVEMDKSLNTTQHTPGPWTAYNAINGRVLNYWHVSAGEIGIAELRNLKHNEQIANATLIAAAPDLLAGMEELLEALRKCINNGFEGPQFDRLAMADGSARAIVAKAKATQTL